MNPYYSATIPAPRLGANRSQPVNEVSLAVEAAFDMLPAPDDIQTGGAGFAVATGSNGAYFAAVSPWPATLAEGQRVRIKVNHTNPGGGVETFKLNGFDPKPIRDNGGRTLLAGMMVQGTIVSLTYIVGWWQLDQSMVTPGWIDVDLIRRAAAVVRPEDFSTGTTIERLSAAFAAGLSTGLPVRLDGVYAISSAIPLVQFSTGGLRVEGSGRIVSSATAGVAAAFHAPYTSTVNVTSITETTRIFPGTSVGTSDATKIIAPSHGCAVGDLIKIVSDDILVPVSLSATRRRGEFAYVADVSGSDVYVGGQLLDTYSTNVRLVRVSQARFEWDGPSFEATSNAGSASLTLLRVRGFYRPRVRAAFDHGSAIGLDLTSCYMADVDVAGLKFLNRVTSGQSSGYLVQDQASAMSQVRVSAVDHRHAYTTTSLTSTANGEPFLYGRTEGSVVRGAAAASSAASFDTHTEAVGITFDTCQSAAARYEESAAGAGFQLRGTRNRAVDCSDRGSQTGLLFYAQEPGGDCSDCEAIGFNYVGPGEAIRINNTSAPQNAIRPLVRGGKVASSGTRSITAERCVGAIIEDMVFTPTGGVNGSYGILLKGGAEVLARRLTFDLARFTGAEFRPFGFDTGTTGNRLVVESARVINGSGKFQSWFSGSDTTGHLVLGGLKADSLPSSGPIINYASLNSLVLSDGWSTIAVWDQSVDGSKATVDFLGVDCDEVQIICRGVTKSVSGTLDLRVSTNSGTSWKATSGDYVEIDAAGVETALTSVRIHDTAATAARSGAISVSGLKDIGKKLAQAHNRPAFATIEGTSVINAVRVLPSGGGNLTGGTITLLGR